VIEMLDIGRILVDGGVLSLAASLVLFAILRYNPRLFLQDYPQDIQNAVPAKTKEEKRQSLLLGTPFLVLLAVVPFLSTLALKRHGAGNAPFVRLFLNAFGVVMVFNLVDLVLLDWLMFCTITPRFVVIPGTEGMEAYRDYAYHLKASIRGTIICAVAALAIAAIVLLL
jgi:hypothetical protein